MCKCFRSSRSFSGILFFILGVYMSVITLSLLIIMRFVCILIMHNTLPIYVINTLTLIVTGAVWDMVIAENILY